MQDETEIYEAVGGDAPFFALVEEFYKLVEQTPDLRSLYPTDLGPGKQHLAWFLIQRFGGPSYFNQRRGDPRLRMRHVPFSITKPMRDAWVSCMMAAVEAVPAFAECQALMRNYFENAATFLINREDEGPGRTRLETL